MSQPTLGELDIRVRELLSEGGRQFFTPEMVRSALNDGQDFIVGEELYIVRGGFKFWSVPNQTTYLLREEMLAPEQLYGRINGQPYRVDFENSDELDRRTYMGGSIGTSTYVTRCTYSRVKEGLEAVIYPALSTYTPLVYRGAMRMKPLVNTTDRTECPPGLSHVLIHYALTQCKMKDEEVRQAESWDVILQRDVREIRGRRMREQASDKNARAMIRRRQWGLRR